MVDVDEEAVRGLGMKFVLPFMVKDRRNLKYLILASIVVGIILYAWAMDDLADNQYRYVMGPTIFVLIGFGLIPYLIWYWTKGPGGKYLDMIDEMKKAGISEPKPFAYWKNLDDQFALAITSGRWNETLQLSEIFLQHRVELEMSPHFLIVSSAEEMRALSYFHLERYEEAITFYHAAIKYKTARGFDCTNEADILNQCMDKVASQPATQTFAQPTAQPQFAPTAIPSPAVQPAVKICPYCQVENPAMNLQCQMCLSNLT